MKLIKRQYLNNLIQTVDTPDIKVITGLRRSGKSKLLESFIDYVYNLKDTNIVHIDFSLIDFEDLQDYHKLNEYIEKRYIKEKRNFLFIDEVQMCDDFEKVINSLYTKGYFNIYLSGSNAFLLSSDLATLFTGRTIEIPVFPFSFKEYLQYHEIANPIDNFDDYVINGGMSGSYLYSDEKLKYEYLKGVFTTIIERDLVKRKKIRNKALLLKLTDFLMDNIGNISSSNGIANYLSSNGDEKNDKTINSYIKGLCDSFLFYKISRYAVSGKKYLSSNEKYYLSDVSFKYAVLGKKNMNYGRIYENLVAIELLRRGYEVYVGVLYQKEIDFVAIKKDEKIYIQVSDDISEGKTFNRETDPLLRINDAYPKIIIARTKHPMTIYEGIKIYDIGEWLAQ